MSLDTLHEPSLGDANCGCQARDGHTSCQSFVLHHPASLQRVFGAAHEKIISAQNNFTCVPSQMQNQLAVVQTLKYMNRALPKIRSFHFRRLAAQVHRIVQHGRLGVQGHADTRPSRGDVARFHASFPAWTPVRLDKNTHRFALICTATYAACLFCTFHSAKNYKPYYTAPHHFKLYGMCVLYFYFLATLVPAVSLALRALRTCALACPSCPRSSATAG